MSKDISKKLQSLIKLISFFKQIRHQDTREKLGFFFVNDLFNLVPFRQCILWDYAGGKVSLLAASGQIDIEKNSPLAQFVIGAVKNKIANEPIISDEDKRGTFIKEHGFAHLSDLGRDDISGFSNLDIEEFLAPNMSHILLFNKNSVIGGVWLARENDLGEIEKAILEDACDALAAKLDAFSSTSKNVFKSGALSKKIKIASMLAILIFCLWPVHFSVTTSTEIIAKDISVVTIPFNGLIENVYVDPNDRIEEGELLFSMDKTRLNNEFALSKQSLETARERLSKTEREVFADPKKNSELNPLREEVKLKLLELSYSKERLDLSDVKATKAGIVLFSDKNDLVGQPAQAGEKIMTLADPKEMELLVRIPADSMIELNTDIPIRFFLNVAPLSSHRAQVYNVSYKPSPDAGGLLTYKARAKIEDIERIEKIGLTGTAKLYGGRTVMIFNLLRRPFIALRNLSGF